MDARIHPIERARERYGLTLTNADVHRIEQEIETGIAVLVRKERWGDCIYMVRHGVTVMIAVYGAGADGFIGSRIITFLPANAITSGARVRRLPGHYRKASYAGKDRRR